MDRKIVCAVVFVALCVLGVSAQGDSAFKNGTIKVVKQEALFIKVVKKCSQYTPDLSNAQFYRTINGSSNPKKDSVEMKEPIPMGKNNDTIDFYKLFSKNISFRYPYKDTLYLDSVHLRINVSILGEMQSVRSIWFDTFVTSTVTLSGKAQTMKVQNRFGPPQELEKQCLATANLVHKWIPASCAINGQKPVNTGAEIDMMIYFSNFEFREEEYKTSVTK